MGFSFGMFSLPSLGGHGTVQTEWFPYIVSYGKVRRGKGGSSRFGEPPVPEEILKGLFIRTGVYGF